MYRYLLFDLDGTLTDSREGIVHCVRETILGYGDPVPEEETLLRFIGPPLQDSFMRFCGYSAEKAAEAVERLKQESRNYAKRQFTWFRREEAIHWLLADTFPGEEALFREALAIARRELALTEG